MSTKEQLLSLFENNKGVYFSGEEIAEKLNVSRTAVWKAVNSLKQEGYEIDAVRNKGYCLSMDTDILSKQGIVSYLDENAGKLDITVLPSVTSTNTLLKEKAGEGAGEGLCIIAGNQTGGKGRIGRSFYSPSETGVYLSILLRPERFSAEKSTKITTMAAVAACEAIEKVSGKEASIKWVNDIFVGGKKAVGILTEGSFGLEDGFLEYAVLGIGFNVYEPEGGFPEEIRDIAGAILDGFIPDGKNRIAAEFLNCFMSYYKDGFERYVEKYRSRSFVIGKDIDVHFRGTVTKARAVGIDNDCGLIVQYEDGALNTLSSGEISIRFDGRGL